MHEAFALEAWANGKIRSLPAWRINMSTEVSVPSYPGGSRKRVSKAGAAVREGRATLDDLATIDLWRAAHRAVLNTFQAILRTRARNKTIIVAQRHKRKKHYI